MKQLLYILFLLTSLCYGQIFPGAQGFGKDITGGRGGVVIKVVNLNDTGTGSLRAACEVSGTRNVVFDVAGTISVSTPILIDDPNITIWGSTAARNGGGGITIRLNQASNNGESLLYVRANNQFIENIRLRRGAGNDLSNGDGLLSYNGGGGTNLDGLYIKNCSFSWSTDELCNINNTSNVTLDSCIFSEALANAGHSEGEHSKGLFVDASINISAINNFHVHNNDRNGYFQNTGDYEYVNNFIHNYGNFGSQQYLTNGTIGANYIGNVFQRGVNSSTSRYVITNHIGDNVKFYVEDNIDELKRTSTGQSEWLIVGDVFSQTAQNTSKQSLTMYSYPASLTPNISSGNLRSTLAALVGVFPRDAVDMRIINDVLNDTGAVIDNPTSVGGWPTVNAMSSVPLDTDSDGLPDDYEDANGLNKNSVSDGQADSGNGYTNFEVYAHTLMGIDQAPITGLVKKRKKAHSELLSAMFN